MKIILVILMLGSFAFSKDGFRIPKESLPNTEGVSVNISDLNKSGVILFINFWAEWCTSCKKEIPELNAIKKQYEERPDIRFIAINGGDSEAKMKRFLKKNPFHFEILKDSEKKFSKDFGVTSLPQTFIIKDSRILFHKFVPPTQDELAGIFKKEK